MAPLFLCGAKADALSFFAEKVAEEDAIIAAKQNRAPRDPRHQIGVAFVTFRDRATAHAAAMSNLMGTTYSMPLSRHWQTRFAPSPATVNWPQLRTTHVARFVRSAIVNALTFALVFFWMIPVAFASSLANLTTLTTVLPFLEPVLNLAPVVKGFIEGFLPGLVLIIFFAILVDVIIVNMARAEHHPDLGDEKRSVFSIYYLFLIFNVFLGSIVATGIINVIGAIIANPTSALSTIAQSFPGQVSYFISYVMILSLSRQSMALWRPGPLVVRWLFQSFLAKTKRAHRKPDGPYYDTLHVAMAIHCLVFCLVAVYSTLNPLIIAFGMVYFGLGYVVGRYNNVYVYTTRTESQGALFPAIFTRLCWSLLVSQLAIAIIVGIAEFIAAVALIPLILATLGFWIWTDRQSHSLASNGALLIDPLAIDALANEHPVYPAADTYQYPTLRKPLFQVESQDPAAQAEPARTWWPVSFVHRDTGEEATEHALKGWQRDSAFSPESDFDLGTVVEL